VSSLLTASKILTQTLGPQVLEDNIFERAAQARQQKEGLREGAGAMEVDPPAPAALPPHAEAASSGAAKDDLAPGPPKRVRFSEPPALEAHGGADR